MYEVRQSGQKAKQRNLVIAALLASQWADENGRAAELFMSQGRDWKLIGKIAPPRREPGMHQLTIDVAGREPDPALAVAEAECLQE